jgi:hypothetical protein
MLAKEKSKFPNYVANINNLLGEKANPFDNLINMNNIFKSNVFFFRINFGCFFHEIFGVYCNIVEWYEREGEKT